MNSIITKQNLTQEIERGVKEIERGGQIEGNRRRKQGKEKGKGKGRSGEEKRGIVDDRLGNCRVRQTLTLFFKGLALFLVYFFSSRRFYMQYREGQESQLLFEYV
jgi:hypothetical protein